MLFCSWPLPLFPSLSDTDYITAAGGNQYTNCTKFCGFRDKNLCNFFAKNTWQILRGMVYWKIRRATIESASPKEKEPFGSFLQSPLRGMFLRLFLSPVLSPWETHPRNGRDWFLVTEIIHHRSASHFYSVLERAFGSHLLHAHDGGRAWELSSSAWSYILNLWVPFLSVALPQLWNYYNIIGGWCQVLF